MHSLEIGMLHITKILSASVIYYLGLKNGKITCQTMWEHKRVSNRYVVISGQLNLFCKKQWSNEDFQTQKDLENTTKSLEFHSLTDLRFFYGISGRVSTYQQIDKYFSLCRLGLSFISCAKITGNFTGEVYCP